MAVRANILRRMITQASNTALVPLLILTLGVGASTSAARLIQSGIEQKIHLEFNHEATLLRDEAKRRLSLYAYGLYGTRGAFAVSEHVGRSEFKAYADSRDFRREFPGALGFGYIERVPSEKLDAFVTQQRATGAPDFEVKHLGKGSEHFIIKYIEPMGPNAPALGYDIGSDATRRAAALQAMLTGQPALSRPVKLIFDSRQRRGFLYLLPIYRKGTEPTTPEERVAALEGWVYAPLVIDDVLSDALHAVDDQLDFEIFDGLKPSAESLVFDADDHLSSHPHGQVDADDYGVRHYQKQSSLSIGGRDWSMWISSKPGFESAMDRNTSAIVFWGGTIISGLITAVVISFSRSRARAMSLAEQMTEEYRLSQQREAEARAAAEATLAELASHKYALDKHAIVAVTDAAGRILHANDRFCELSQYSREELIGQNHRLINSGYHPRQFWIDMWRTISRGEVWQNEVCNRAKDGSLYWVDTTVVPFKEPDGRIGQFVAIRTDITARKHAEAQATEARMRLQEVLDAATEVSIIACDHSGRIMQFSRGAEKMVGYRAEEMIGKQTPEIFHDREEVMARARELSAQFGRPISGFETFVAVAARDGAERREWIYVCRDGTRKTVELSVTAIRDRHNELVGYLGTANDITRRKQTEADLRAYAEAIESAHTKLEIQAIELEFQANELRDASRRADAANAAKSQFLANMSHEIRTPLTAVLGYAELLRDDKADALPTLGRTEIVDTICNAGQHLLTIINDILDLSKIEAGQMTLERVECSLPNLLRELETLLSPRATGKGVQFQLELATPIPELMLCDPTRLRQILMNLVGNAVKFTEEGSIVTEVSVVSDPQGQRLRLDVIDTGKGLTTLQATQLFRPFTQADTTVTRKYGGTGLGLTISRRLAKMLGGDVSLVRSEPGVGSCFRLELPLEAPSAAVWSSSLAPVGETSAKRMEQTSATLAGRILFAEDGPDNQRLISLVLRKAGATVEIAENGRIAGEMWEQALAEGRPYDLLLTDVQMPEMDGLSLTQWLRRRGETRPIIALTAHAMAEDQQKCLAAGCDAFATKPIDRAKLIATCAAWIGKTQLQTAN